MKKTILRYAFATALAGGTYLLFNTDSNAKDIEKEKTTDIAIVQQDPNEVYRFPSGHPLTGQTRTRQQIENQNLCPAGIQECAVPDDENSESDPIQWAGASSKF